MQLDVCRTGVSAAQQASYVHAGPAKWQKPCLPPVPAHFTLLSSSGKAAQHESSLCCAPPAVLPEERRERTNPLLWPKFLKWWSHQPRAQSKTTEVNLQVSIVFFFPFLLCKLSLFFLFSTHLAKILLLQLKVCPVIELHIGFA